MRDGHAGVNTNLGLHYRPSVQEPERLSAVLRWHFSPSVGKYVCRSPEPVNMLTPSFCLSVSGRVAPSAIRDEFSPASAWPKALV